MYCRLTESLIRVPICLGAASSVHQIFNCQSVQLFVVSQDPNDIPTEAIHIDPTTLCPRLLWLREEIFQIMIVQICFPDFLVREVYHCDIAFLMEVTVIGLGLLFGVNTRLCTRLLPIRMLLRLVEPDSVGTRRSSPQGADGLCGREQTAAVGVCCCGRHLAGRTSTHRASCFHLGVDSEGLASANARPRLGSRGVTAAILRCGWRCKILHFCSLVRWGGHCAGSWQGRDYQTKPKGCGDDLWGICRGNGAPRREKSKKSSH